MFLPDNETFPDWPGYAKVVTVDEWGYAEVTYTEQVVTAANWQQGTDPSPVIMWDGRLSRLLRHDEAVTGPCTFVTTDRGLGYYLDTPTPPKNESGTDEPYIVKG